jgi:diguanylate cyclase (GGDEF)-like protein/PAS domain S-box-containing protein
VQIDQQSLERIGPWPWPRRVHARLIDRLAAAGPPVIGYDVLFAEPSIGDPAGDLDLEEAVARAGNVVLPVVAEAPAAGQPPVEILPFGRLPELARALGHAHLRPDADGRLRRLQLAAGVGDAFWPAFAVAVERQIRPRGSAPATFRGGRPPGSFLDWVEDGEALVPVAADPRRLRRHSAADVLLGERLPSLADTAVLVGVTARGLAAPVRMGSGADTAPPIAFQALAVEDLLQGRTVAPFRWPELAAAGLAAGAFLPWLFAAWRRPVLARSAFAMAPLLPLLTGIGALLLSRLMLPFASVTVTLLGLLVVARLGEAARRVRRAQLERSLAHAALTHVADAVLTTDDAGVVDYANPAAAKLFGRAAETLVGLPLAELAPPVAELARQTIEDLEPPTPALLAAQLARPARGGAALGAIRLTAADGRQRSVRATARRFGSPAGSHLVLALNDITDEQRLLDEVAFRATHDSLTGLPNRHLLTDRLAGALDRARRAGNRVAVVFLDVDRLKSINDALGHAVGDAVLVEVASRFRLLGRSTDTVGRIGGDEFVLVLDGLESRTEIAAAVNRYRGAFARPVVVGGRPLPVRASFGVAVFPDDGDSPDSLLRRADSAMYRAKRDGRDQVVTFDAELHGETGDGLLLDAALRDAIARDGLELHYQPRIDLVERRPAGLESLVRWRHPDEGLLPPARFIGLAEETGSIVELGRWVLERACADLAGPALRDRGLQLSVNVSVVQLKRDPGFVDFVRGTLTRHGLAPQRIELEVTENLFLDPSLPMLGRRLASLAELGLHLSIDDFGTGYSSLAYINRFPFDRIKIDRSFVDLIDRDQGAQAIVRAIVGLSTALAKQTTAEGVEKDAQLAFLDELSCNEAQGFFFGRPAPLPEMLRALPG